MQLATVVTIAAYSNTYRLRHCRRPILVFREASSRFGDSGVRRLESLVCQARGLETLESEVWRDQSLEVTNVSRIVGLGGSIRRILRGSEAPGGPDSYRLENPMAQSS